MVNKENPKSKRATWDETLMNLAVMVSRRAACKFHETGCVFADERNRIISMGYNGPTEGDLHCIEDGCAKVDGDPKTKKLRRCRGIHAEINGIINARDSKTLKNSIIYTVLFPCYDCMKALNNVGVKEIVFLNNYVRIQTGGEKFEEEDEAIELAKTRGIKVRKYEGEIFLKM